MPVNDARLISAAGLRPDRILQPWFPCHANGTLLKTDIGLCAWLCCRPVFDVISGPAIPVSFYRPCVMRAAGPRYPHEPGDLLAMLPYSMGRKSARIAV